jgi:hypothetical protein
MTQPKQHTPPPWKYDPITQCVNRGAATVLHHVGLSPADGYLIAAAPALFDACQAVLSAWQSAPRSHQKHWAAAVNSAAHALRMAESRGESEAA